VSETIFGTVAIEEVVTVFQADAFDDSIEEKHPRNGAEK